jgi:hypothetical protein
MLQILPAAPNWSFAGCPEVRTPLCKTIASAASRDEEALLECEHVRAARSTSGAPRIPTETPRVVIASRIV